MCKIRALIKRPDEEIGHVTAISKSLRNLQRTVQGHIETVTITQPTVEEDGVVIICNEEGRLLDFPANCIVKIPAGPNKGAVVSFVGDIIVVGHNDEDFTDLPDWVTRKEWGSWLMKEE